MPQLYHVPRFFNSESFTNMPSNLDSTAEGLHPPEVAVRNTKVDISPEEEMSPELVMYKTFLPNVYIQHDPEIQHI